MQIEVNWQGNSAFEGITETDNRVLMDAPSEGGGKNLGPRPMEMLLMGMAACSGYDVVQILKKARQQLSDCKIAVHAERADTIPKIFTHIHLHFTLIGKGLGEKQIERALKLSAEKYCSASIMLGHTAQITHDYEIQANLS